MLKYKLINNKVNNILIPLENNIDHINNVNFEDEINNLPSEFIDQDVKKYSLSNNINMIFGFFKNNTYENTFINAGFEENEISLSNRNYRFSYILMQVFDTIDFKTQSLLHSSYIPIYLFPDKISTSFEIFPSIKYFEFNNIYIQNNIILTDNQKLYCNFKFYNAKTGKLSIMYNNSVISNNQDRFYFEILINMNNSTYSFTNQNINAKEFINEEYLNKINRLNKTENKTPIYPNGTLFDVNGNYIN